MAALEELCTQYDVPWDASDVHATSMKLIGRIQYCKQTRGTNGATYVERRR